MTSKKKCQLCGTESNVSGDFRIDFNYPGVAQVSVSKDGICEHCALRLRPKFRDLINECSPICSDPWDLVYENQQLRNRIHELEIELNANRRR